MNWSALKSRVKKHEGFRGTPYLDTVGKTTIGYGRNLDDRPLTEEEGELLLNRDLGVAYEDAQRVLGEGFAVLSDERQQVLVEMALNLGQARLRGFKKMLEAVRDGHYAIAAAEMLDSQWALQVGRRATTLADLMRGYTLPRPQDVA